VENNSAFARPKAGLSVVRPPLPPDSLNEPNYLGSVLFAVCYVLLCCCCCCRCCCCSCNCCCQAAVRLLVGCACFNHLRRTAAVVRLLPPTLSLSVGSWVDHYRFHELTFHLVFFFLSGDGFILAAGGGGRSRGQEGAQHSLQEAQEGGPAAGGSGPFRGGQCIELYMDTFQADTPPLIDARMLARSFRFSSLEYCSALGTTAFALVPAMW